MTDHSAWLVMSTTMSLRKPHEEQHPVEVAFVMHGVAGQRTVET